MKTAKEMRLLTCARMGNVETILEYIEEEANEGKFGMTWKNELSQYDRQLLIELGYLIKGKQQPYEISWI